jgi:hypothetical protein
MKERDNNDERYKKRIGRQKTDKRESKINNKMERNIKEGEKKRQTLRVKIY